MSDDLPANRPPKSRPEVSRNRADAQDMLLPGSLKTALLRELSPSRSQRQRVQSAIAAGIGAGATSPALDQANAEMAARAGQLHAASMAGGTSLATKVVISSLVLASAAAITTISLQRSEPRSVTPAPSVAREPRTPSVPEAKPPAEPGPAPAAKLEPKVSADAPANNAPSATPEPPNGVVHARPRRVRAAVSPPGPALEPADPLERGASKSSTSTAESSATTVPSAPAPKPTLTLAGEIALVRGASDALERQDAKSALALLARYRQTYPAGSLAIEVQALRAIALCLDKQPRAAEARDAFLREHGSSALAGRVRSGCQ